METERKEEGGGGQGINARPVKYDQRTCKNMLNAFPKNSQGIGKIAIRVMIKRKFIIS